MAQLGRFEITVQDSAGNAVTGAVVELCKQGAQVFGNQAGPVTVINVDDCGAIVAGDLVYVNALGVTRSVSSVTATTVTVGAPGFTGLIDDDRLVCFTTHPNTYEDALGNTTKANPLTSDANGYASCYTEGGKYDVRIAGGGLTQRVVQDVTVVGEDSRSNIYNSGAAVAFKFDTLRALGAADKILQVSNQGSTEAFSVGGTGNAAIAGTLAVTGASTLTGAVTATAGVTATTGNVQATVGNLIGKRTFLTKGTAVVNGDFVQSAGWGSTAAVSAATGTDSRGFIAITCNGAGIAANPTILFTYHDGTWTTTPFGVIVRTDSNAPTTGWFTISCSTVTASITFVGLPVAATSYSFTWMIEG